MGVYGPDFSQCVWGEDGGWGNGGDGRRLHGISGFHVQPYGMGRSEEGRNGWVLVESKCSLKRQEQECGPSPGLPLLRLKSERDQVHAEAWDFVLWAAPGL